MTPPTPTRPHSTPVSLGRTRARVLGANTIRRTVLLLAVVSAVVLGLLAMHTLQTGMGNHNVPMNSTGEMSAIGDTAHHADETLPGTDTVVGADVMGGSHRHVTSSECSGMCDPEHTMAGMICVLALLLTGLLLAAIRPASTYTSTPLAPVLLRVVDAAVARPGPAPPDLNVLSISRT
ncbi:hypothetical protein B7R54_19120 [Subtercola boreus]|uniref:Uncharacterized protein n=1 Tax=Subtercola boreus TaxID=120213 RepID=A0A3E0VAD2_9MICO|nr:DUF6153 family protein [Subtercola boreus]RFA06483.1 hypothetical protein B7R54_19120 [Subtercola boreus]TQL46936.1 hypothetical protein FB464_3931 [Subtercola boreus]